MMRREYVEGEEVVNFYACGSKPYNKLSNFAFIAEGIVYDGLRYCSTEHAFQSQKYIKEQRYRFSIDGDLGNVDGFQLVFGDDWEKKRTYWMKKENIGIIAKMATNIKIGKKLGLIRDEDFVSTDHLWFELLTLKFAIREFNVILKGTLDKYLLEFDRGAKRCEQYGKQSLWAGIIEENKLYGNNLMGNYIMWVRGLL
jgi:hypothetical protein